MYFGKDTQDFGSIVQVDYFYFFFYLYIICLLLSVGDRDGYRIKIFFLQFFILYK